jgi:hypothetical protein
MVRNRAAWGTGDLFGCRGSQAESHRAAEDRRRDAPDSEALLSEFHYVRTNGAEGGVDAVDGPAIGLDLESILADGLPPVKVAFEIIAALCEILDIADQDGEVHGLVEPKYIFIDETGAVSLEGFGAAHPKIRAPEGTPQGPLTDLYGLGYTIFRLISQSQDLETLPQEDPDGHDNAVIDAAVGIDFSDFPEEMCGDIQWYIAKLMSFDWEERPPAVDAWRTFIAFANEAQGIGLEGWGEKLISEGDAPRRGGPVPASPGASPAPAGGARKPEPEPSEDLDGPVLKSGPLASGALNFGGAGAKPGQATAFWSRDAMKAALQAADDDEDESPAPGKPAAKPAGGPPGGFRPSVGGGSATAFWSVDQMKAMAEGAADAPRPKRKEGGGTAMFRRPAAGQPPTPAGKPAQPGQPPAAPPPPPGPGPRPAGPPPAPPAPPQQPAPPPAGPIAVGGPVAGPGAAPPGYAPGPPPGYPPAAPAQEGGSKNLILMGVGALLLLVLCGGGVAALGGGALLMGGSGDSPAPSASKSEKVEKADSKSKKSKSDTGAPKGDEPPSAPNKPAEAAPTKAEPAKAPPAAPKSEPAKAPTTSGTKGTTSGTKGTTSGTKGTTSGTKGSATKPPAAVRPTTTAPPPASGPARVTFNLGSRGTVGCGDGQRKDADGSTTMTFEASNLPVSCMITVDGKMWAGLVTKSGTVNCRASGGDLSCSGP